jgi:hypothetical protein
MNIRGRNLLLGPHLRTTVVKITRIVLVAALLASFIGAATTSAQNSQTASVDDTARLLAGMSISENSPLAKLAQDSSAKQHANYFDTAFGNVEKNQLSKIRAWSSANLTSPQPVMFYMFGGPDFLYADAFFPNATTYVLSGLEPVGQVPDLLKLQPGTVMQAQRNIQRSLRTVLTISYFITAHMMSDLSSGPVNGTLPVLYVFLARSGKTIRDVSLVHLNELGELQPGEGTRQSPARGVKIVFTTADSQPKTLYYFSTDLTNERGRNKALLQFCKSFGQGDSFVKSASYILHDSYFSQVRDFLLNNSKSILQDDTGIPVSYFNSEYWHLQPFGRYVGPIPMFEGNYQWRLNELFRKNRTGLLEFGVGYRWHPNESNLLLAVKTADIPEVTATVAQAPVPLPQYRASQRRAENEPPPFPIFPFSFRPPPQQQSQIPFRRDYE